MTNPIETKIQNLLNTANHPNTPPHEADTAMAMATKLMAKYAIDAKMLRPSAQPDEVISKVIHVTGQYASQRVVLLHCIAKPWGVLSCKSGRDQLTLVGTAADIAQVEQLFASLDVQMAAECVRARPASARNGAQVVSWRTNFQKGFAGIVMSRLVEQRKNATQEAIVEHGSGVGIMLADSDRRTAAKFRELFPRTTTSRRRAGAGYLAGGVAGGRANIGNRQIAGRAAIGR